eukprot:5128517-Pleurochrysis_carterae.AAC.1
MWRPAKYGLSLDGEKRDRERIPRDLQLDARDRIMVQLLRVGDHFEALVWKDPMLKEKVVPKGGKLFEPGALGSYLSVMIFSSDTGLTLWRESRTMEVGTVRHSRSG